ncbi:restriction endonuclease [Vibrio parahaemolyticus]|nr:restriction endonuclease [Vibrio parahaemolyticus]
MESIVTSEDYEKLAKKIYEDILTLEGVDNIEVKHNVKIRGKSGVEHQIDVYWEYRYASVSHKVLIECKHYSHSVSLIHVRNLHGLLTDIPNSSGILITTTGFQSGAKQYAEFYDIGLKLIRPPQDSDWNGCIQIVNVNIDLISTTYLDLKVEYDGHCTETREIIERTPNLKTVDQSLIQVIDENGDIYPIGAYLDLYVVLDLRGLGEVKSAEVIPGNSYFILPNGEKLKLGRLLVKYVAGSNTVDMCIDAKSAVEAILQDVKSGEIEHMHRKNV